MDVETQARLCRKLLKNSVVPYYLHQLDRVQGAGHFDTDESVGESLIRELEKRLPGFGVPKWVREIAGEPNKTRL